MMPRHPLAAWRGRIERLEHPLRRDQDAEAALSPLSLRGGRKVARHSGLISTSLHQVRPALYRSADVGLESGTESSNSPPSSEESSELGPGPCRIRQVFEGVVMLPSPDGTGARGRVPTTALASP